MDYNWIRKKSLKIRQLEPQIIAELNKLDRTKPNNIALYYAGGSKGSIGGGLVKVNRLQSVFREHKYGFNLVYNLSNWSLLNESAINSLRSQKIPIVHNQNGTFYRAWYKGDCEWENQNMAKTYHAANYVFFQSEFCRMAAAYHLGERKGPSEVLYNAVDTDFFWPRETKTKNKSLIFLITGKIDSSTWHRVHCALEALKLAVAEKRKFKIIIAGWLSSQAKQFLGETINEYKLSEYVSYSGPYSQDEAPAIYNQADAYMMLKHQDPCPNTVIEAMSCGLPVLYSDTGGVAELVGESAGVGLHCETSWEQAHTPSPECILTGMKHIEVGMSKMSKEARQRACERFGIDLWMERHQNIFSSLIQSNVIN